MESDRAHAGRHRTDANVKDAVIAGNTFEGVAKPLRLEAPENVAVLRRPGQGIRGQPKPALAQPIPVSVIIMTKDEEGNIAECLRSVKRFGQVFVVDSGSRDRTGVIAESMGTTVVPFRWNGRYPKKKQWCLEELPFRHDWVLYVDADEMVTPELADEIGEVMAGPRRHAGYFVGYDYVFLDRVLRHGHRVYKLVLFDRHKARFAERDDLTWRTEWRSSCKYKSREASAYSDIACATRITHPLPYFDRQIATPTEALLQSGTP
jgi:glycosyltransferase involved in cell wall biosynthesis